MAALGLRNDHAYDSLTIFSQGGRLFPSRMTAPF
jgi:hypothetical protein